MMILMFYIAVDASPGAEVWAWFNAKNATTETIDSQWKELCGVLSGLLCASLSFIDNSNTVEPEFSFRATFSPGRGRSVGQMDTNNTPLRIRYATLPREIVCTENLTPWKKLLPCNHHEGIASLLNSGHIHTTNYHSLGLHVRMLCDGPAKTCTSQSPQQLELRQTVNLVFDKKLMATNAVSQRDWSTRKMFGQGLNGACVLATSSRVYVDMNDNDYQLSPAPSHIAVSQRGGATTQYAVYDIKKDYAHQMFNVAALYKTAQGDVSRVNSVALTSPPPLYAKRFLLGVGQERGRIVTKVTNTHWTSLNIILQENLPWFVPVYLHTLSLKVVGSGAIIKPNAMRYVPGRLRERPSHLEIAFQCPTRATVEISIDFDYVFLKWLEYPPDANHGHYIGSAVLTAALPTARNFTAIPIDGQLFADSFNASRAAGYVIHLRTEALLISLPTPDFSMPYNVICLACTVVALAFGPIHNVSTKKLTGKRDEDKDAKPKSMLGKLKCKFFGKSKALGKSEEDKGTEPVEDKQAERISLLAKLRCHWFGKSKSE